MSRIKLLVPVLPAHGDVAPFLEEIDANRWYTNFGPLARRFEAALGAALHVPAEAVCSVANCTVGLEMALAAMNLPTGARVLVPSLTFIATAAAILRAGFHPVIADVDPRTWTLTPDIARDALGRGRVDCVMPVAAFGCPVPVADWDAFAEATGLPVLIDAAGAFGNQSVGRRAAVVFSFHATKTLGIGEGGAVVSTDEALVERVRRLSNFGIDVSSGFSMAVGTNGKLSEYHAATGLAALALWPGNAEQRRKLHRDYRALLARACPDLVHQVRPDDGVYSILQVCLPRANNAHVADQLAQQGIETRRWYLPLLTDHPAFAHCPVQGELPNARRLSGRLLGLPFHLDLGEAQLLEVARALAAAMEMPE
ncbi:MAG TPA: DegT/DnrJ/EryC1/StrS family aminotransferase [Burkholderiales bacterium]|nr:DegT/DnrJ/EryC1/StrS family aminotransferase [Burkholderiales bacterium]